MGSISQYSVFSDETLQSHLRLLEPAPTGQESTESSLAPLVTSCAFVQNQPDETPSITQFGLLAGVHSDIPNRLATIPANDCRLFFNVSPPSSTFICGSQGSGKSHTLSCILENCLIPSIAGHLPSPLTGVVFHYDTFISDSMGSPCKAAFLSTHPQINVRVLCAPTNIHTIRGTYSRFNISVEPLRIDQESLNTKRMLELMAVGQDDGPMPLYMHTVKRILRDMRMIQQESGAGFDYQTFKRSLLSSNLTPSQLDPLSQRLETLESFMPPSQSANTGKKGKRPTGGARIGHQRRAN
ncbi:hypothetical protein N8T08_009659 [Aspergillus melleus]|uniref:Uncharacterized protein n=1 Tax=Aspergillus melleus TaxID=138277 RepID=A0ACC3ATC3_9EURO|nr:hypothetical protein N8T08_009659 [Aspergillus melleus]